MLRHKREIFVQIFSTFLNIIFQWQERMLPSAELNFRIIKVHLTLIVLTTLYNILDISFIIENRNTQHGGITSIHKTLLYWHHMLRYSKLGEAGERAYEK
jgi:hypothetical protein